MQRAVEGTGSNKANLDDYNPFDAQKNITTPGNNSTGMLSKYATRYDSICHLKFCREK